MFEITANNLMRNSDIKTLKLQDENYNIIFFYYGEYEEDMKKNGRCDVANLSMSCKKKGDAPAITCMSGKMFIDTEVELLLSVEEIEAFKKQLDAACASAVELQGIIEQYFGI